MSKAPFYNVFIDNDAKRDITYLIDKFKFEDCLHKDDLVELTINPDFSWEFDNEKEIITGQNLVFEFGYLGLESSGYRKARITDIEPRFAERITIKIKCLDKGNVMKKSNSGKVWKNKTTKQIIEEIASSYDMKAFCDIEGITWKSKVQGLKSDWHFLKEIVEAEQDGDYTIFCRDNALYFTKIGVEKKSRRTFTYKDPVSGWISFSPKHNESTAKPSGVNATMVAHDPLTQKPVKTISKNTEIDKSTGEFAFVFDEKYNKTKTKKAAVVQNETKDDGFLGKVSVIGKILPSPPMEEKELSNRTKSHNKKNSLANVTATLEIEGDPTMVANEIITINGTFQKYNGNWLITEAIHNIGAGYTTTLELEKNGAKQGIQKFGTNTKVNKSIGSEKSEAKTRKIKFDGDTTTRI